MHAPKLAIWLVWLLSVLLLLGCVQSLQAVKIGLIAPFEGQYREIGVDVIPAARLAIREYAEQSQETGVAIELVAYDDSGDPALAADQARILLTDPDIVMVIGHWRDNTTQAALPVYVDAHIPLVTVSAATFEESGNNAIYYISPAYATLQSAATQWADTQLDESEIMIEQFQRTMSEEIGRVINHNGTATFLGNPDWGLSQFYSLTNGLADGQYYVSADILPELVPPSVMPESQIDIFITRYTEGNIGIPPGPMAFRAYYATWFAIQQVVARAGSSARTPFDASFNEKGPDNRLALPLYLFQWTDGQRTLISQLYP
nr:ABC transporter substrate-binding protein [Anaerolineae bacterium]